MLWRPGAVRFMEDKQVIKVVAGVLERNGKILVCRRRNQDGSPGKWEFPGGKQEPGETEEECLVRELREELCLAVRPGEEIGRVRHDYKEFSVEVVFRHAEAENGNMKLMVHAEAAWAERKSLSDYDFLEADIEFVKRLAEGAL